MSEFALARSIASFVALPFFLGFLLILGRWVLTFLTADSANNGVLKLFRTLTRPFYAVAHKLTRGRGGASSQSIVALLITVLGIVLTQLGFILWVIFAA